MSVPNTSSMFVRWVIQLRSIKKTCLEAQNILLVFIRIFGVFAWNPHRTLEVHTVCGQTLLYFTLIFMLKEFCYNKEDFGCPCCTDICVHDSLWPFKVVTYITEGDLDRTLLFLGVPELVKYQVCYSSQYYRKKSCDCVSYKASHKRESAYSLTHKSHVHGNTPPLW